MQKLLYSMQLQKIWKVFSAVGLTAEKKTHLLQRASVQNAETHSTLLTQILQAEQ
jgi:hypothetical protein